MSPTNSKVDWFFAKAINWQAEIAALRTLVLACGLEEELKWGCPCYTFNEKNVVLIQHFKEYCALLFFKGALLKDSMGILIQQTENVQAARQIRFKSLQQIMKMKSIVKDYIREAKEAEKKGLKVPLKKTTEYKMPDEFKNVLEDMPELKRAFSALTPGRQRGYLLYFSSPKQSKTREARIEKSVPRILARKGLDD